MDIPPKMYIVCTKSTEKDILRIKQGLTKKEIEKLDKMLEITGHHKSDYEEEVAFPSNYKNDDNESI